MIRCLFPNVGLYTITSPTTVDYNCIAWAVGETGHWWDPDPDYYWPEEAPRQVTLEAFVAMFRSEGYKICDASALEDGYEKIALYARPDLVPTHVARQLPTGRWTSKLGQLEDIEHETLGNLEGSEYGQARIIMKRRRTAGA